MYKFPAYSDRSADLSWKSAIEKLDQISSTLAILIMNIKSTKVDYGSERVKAL